MNHLPKIIAKGVPVDKITKIIGNYVDDINGDQSYDFVVPAGKKWWVYGGFTERLGTNISFFITVFDADDQEILQSPGSGSGSTDIGWGVFSDKDETMKDFNVPFPLPAGWKLTYNYTSNPYNSSVSLFVEEEDA